MSQSQLQLLKLIIGAGDGSASLPIEQLRSNFDRFLKRFPGVEGLTVQSDQIAGVPVEWLGGPWLDQDKLDQAGLAQDGTGQDGLGQDGTAQDEFVAGDAAPLVVYLHGGGFVVGSPESHRQTAARLARAASARCLLVDYRLAPEHPYPAALEDVLGVWRALLESGLDPRRAALAGDSAGGGLGVLAMARMQSLGMALPAASAVLSPWVDYAGTTPSLDKYADVDPVVQRPGLEKMAAFYLAGADPWDPAVTPLRADLRDLPPLLIQVGGSETLLDDARRLDAHARAAAVDVTLDIWPDMIHAWHVFAGRLEEADQALQTAGQFLVDQWAVSAGV